MTKHRPINPLTMSERTSIKDWANAQFAIARRYKPIDPVKSEFYHGRSVAAGKIATTYNPTLHSSRPHALDVLDVAKGIKPAALVNRHATDLAKQKGLVMIKVPSGLFGKMLSGKLEYVVAKTPEKAQRVIDVLRKYSMPRG